MTDFHTHILQNMDDGSKSLQESLELLQWEARCGVTDVVLTPHYYPTQCAPGEFLERRQRRWEELRPRLRPGKLRVHLGAEVQYFDGICFLEDLEDLRIQGSRLLLLEMPFCTWTERMVEDVLTLNNRPEIQIMLAHIERYLPMANGEYLPRLLAENVLIQANLSFFIRWQSRYKAAAMLHRGQIHAFGSDCHDLHHRCPAWEKLPKGIATEARRKSALLASRYLAEATHSVL